MIIKHFNIVFKSTAEYAYSQRLCVYIIIYNSNRISDSRSTITIIRMVFFTGCDKCTTLNYKTS